MRRIHRSDSIQADIVAAWRKAGAKAWIIQEPVDVLLHFYSTSKNCWLWQPVEIKDPSKLNRQDQPEQAAFCKENNVPIISSIKEALELIELQAW